MDKIKNRISSNNKKLELTQNDSRNNHTLIDKKSKTNYSNANIKMKKDFINKNNEIKLKKKIKMPFPKAKIKISLGNKNMKTEKEKEQYSDYQIISYVDTANKTSTKSDNKNNSNNNLNYSNNKNFTVNNNITNNISNHITNIILTNNNFNLKKKFLNNHKKINLDEKKIIFYDSINSYSNYMSQKKMENSQKSINNRNYNSIKKKNYSLTTNNNLFMSNKILYSLNKDKICSQKVISTKDTNKKNIIERNKNNLYKFNTTSSTNNMKTSNKKKSTLVKKNSLKENQSLRINNIIKNVEINSYKNKFRKSKKLKENKAINSINQKHIKFRPSLKLLENTISLNDNKPKNKIQNLKKIQTKINYIINSNNSCRNYDKNKFLKIKKSNKFQNQNKSDKNINIDDVKSFNKIKSLINKNNKSFNDKISNNSININISGIITRSNLNTNISKINKTYNNQDSKSKSKKSKSKENRNLFKNCKFKKKIKLINSINNFKTDRSSGSFKNKNSFTNMTNINTLNNISKINLPTNKNSKSIIINYNNNILNKKGFQNRKKGISMNMNIHKNIKKEIFTKSLGKKNDPSNFIFNYKNNNYNSYKTQYLNLVKSYKNFSYISQEKSSKNYHDLKKLNKYYNNQKKIYEKKSKIKKNNRCQKDSLDLSTINIHHNDLVNLINIKCNKNNEKKKDIIINKELTKPIMPKRLKSPEFIIKLKNIKKTNLSYEQKKEKNFEIKIKRNSKKKSRDSIPLHLLKNILEINSFNENLNQEKEIYSDRFSPNYSKKINLIKNYRNSNYSKNSYLDKNKSLKISMNHGFNIPYSYTMSLNKKKNFNINDILIKKDNKYKSNKDSFSRNNNTIFEREIKNNNDNNMETFELSDEEKDKDLEKAENQIIISENIKNNPQYLGNYLIDILENFLLDEIFYVKKRYINPDYLFSNNNSELNPELRLISINWLIMIHHKVFKFKENTLFLCIQIIDRFLSKKILSIEKTELLILCALIVSSKHEEIDYVNMKESLQLSSNKFTKEQIINMEYDILNELNFELIIPNMNDYYNIYSIILNLSDIEKNKGLYLLNIVLVDYYMLEYPNFILALSVVKIIIKKSVKSIIQLLKDILIKNNDDIYLNMIKDEKTIDKVCDKIKILYKKFILTKYKSIKEKFSEEEYNSVSNLSEEIIF